jgi:hypothetical protein
MNCVLYDFLAESNTVNVGILGKDLVKEFIEQYIEEEYTIISKTPNGVVAESVSDVYKFFEENPTFTGIDYYVTYELNHTIKVVTLELFPNIGAS